MINTIQELEDYIRTEITKRVNDELARLDSMPQLKDNEYQCSCCHNVYERGWTDEEAEAELKSAIPDIDKQDCAIVCDDCYNKIMNITPNNILSND